jgi:hypothetical protein
MLGKFLYYLRTICVVENYKRNIILQLFYAFVNKIVKIRKCSFYKVRVINIC